MQNPMYAPPTFDTASTLLLALPRTHAGQVAAFQWFLGAYMLLSSLLTFDSWLSDNSRLITTLLKMAGAWTIVVYFCLTLPNKHINFLKLHAPT